MVEPSDGPRVLGAGDRYRIGRRLGAGGMGIVYAAYDEVRRAEVALKMLRRPDAEGVFRFKREFRALTDIHHDNLVSLYELVADDARWFFTMELVEGVDFVAHVRGGNAAGSRGDADTIAVSGSRSAAPAVTRTANPGHDDGEADVAHRRSAGAPDLARLREALPQLVRGVMALHGGGHLHRDIKPSNVMVTPAGRVVLLDFGVVAELGVRGSSEGEIVGTPMYMAPEQALGLDAGPPSDWFSVGVLVYEALTGTRPFVRRRGGVPADERLGPGPSPRTLQPDVPADLDALCVDLLARDPATRPTGPTILERLAARRGTSLTPTPRPAPDAVALVGREGALDSLREAFGRTREGSAEVVLVRGASGTGKSALVRRFARHAESYGALVLAGRCYERESVPFKALDPVVDELCSWLMAIEPDEVDEFLPRDAACLGRLFPAVHRLEALAEPGRGGTRPDPQQVRRRAGRALRGIFERVTRRRPVVVFIDDLQWGDADSVPLVEALLRGPDPPPVLWVACQRDLGDPGPLAAAVVGGGAAGHLTLEVGPLPHTDAVALARELLAESRHPDAAAEAIAAESGGNPFFVRELARAVAEAGPESAACPPLATVIRDRVQALEPADRRLVTAVAVAARPIETTAALHAAEVDDADAVGMVPRLVRLQLLRTAGSTTLECYHDRIRESVVGGLDAPARRGTHRRLAEVLLATGHADPETLVDHFLGADDLERAAPHARRAADAAAGALAFERAAALYEVALAGAALPPAEERELHEHLGDAWAQAGRGVPAARALLRAADLADDEAAVHSLRRRAGEQLVRAGRVQPGLDLVKETLRAIGLRFPRTGVGAIAALLGQRARLRLRGLDFDPRDAGAPAADVEARLRYADACWSAAVALVQIEPLLASVFVTRHLRAVLDVGDRPRIARGLLLEALLLSSAGAKARATTTRFATRAARLIRELDDPALRFFQRGAGGIVAFELGDFAEAHTRCEEALSMHERDAAGQFWEIGQVQLFGALAGLFSGRYAAVREGTPERVAEARLRGDVYTTTCLCRAITPLVALLADDPPAARRQVTEALERWGRPDVFENQHFMAFVAGCCTDLYAADVDGALARCVTTDAAMRSSLLVHVQVIRATWRLLRSATRLHALARGDRRGRRQVAADARRLDREGAAWCSGGAATLRAGLRLLDGRTADAIDELRRADACFEPSGFDLFRLPVRWRLGEQLADREGAAMQREVVDTLVEQGVADPGRWIRAFAPPTREDATRRS